MSNPTEEIRQTPLFQAHKNLGAKMVPFAGWWMPVQYQGILHEHLTVRRSVGLFDVSHMGEVEIKGKGALETVQRLFTNDASLLQPGQAQYTLMLNDHGGIVDDLIVYKIHDQQFLIVVNASNEQKDFNWMKIHALAQCTVTNVSGEYALLSVQGPRARELVQAHTDIDVLALPRFSFGYGRLFGMPALLARTGYTGEDGLELFIHPRYVARAWTGLLEKGQPLGITPVGLGARDSLRLEMKYSLYGNDIDEDHTPLEANLGWAVKLAKGDFIGKQVLVQQEEHGVKRKLCGFKMIDRGIARHGYAIIDGNRRIGEVTSGTMSPSLRYGIAMGYVENAYSAIGTKVIIDCRGQRSVAEVVKTPFLQTSG